MQQSRFRYGAASFPWVRQSIILDCVCRLETRRLPEAPVGNCYADKRAYESDAFVAFDESSKADTLFQSNIHWSQSDNEYSDLYKIM